jgi:phosphate:Na+ symporter
MSIFLITIIFGLGLFLTGIFLFSRYAKQILGSDVKEILKRAEGHKWFYFLLGASVTSVFQSSSAISSIVVGLVGSGMVSVFSGILLLAGSSVGSTITAQIISLPIMNYGPLLVTMGLVLWSFGLHGKYLKILGVGIFSIGLLFVGLSLMTGAFNNVKEVGWLTDWLSYAGMNPWYMFLAGVTIALILQSSSVAVAIIMAIVMSGLLVASAAIPFVIGASVGTNITVNLASLITARSGKIVARGFLVFKLLAGILAMLFLTHFTILVELMTAGVNDVRLIANAFTLFNILAAIPIFLLVKRVAQVGAYLAPQKNFLKKSKKRCLANEFF